MQRLVVSALGAADAPAGTSAVVKHNDQNHGRHSVGPFSPNFLLSNRQGIELAAVCRERGSLYWVRSGLRARSSKARCWIGVGLVWSVKTYLSLSAVVAWILA